MEQIAETLRPLAVPVESLNLDAANARQHSRRNLDAIKASLVRFGQRTPIVVQKEGMIVRAGNGRLTIARELGWTHIAAVIVDESAIEATAYAIADNRTAELATWNDDLLSALLGTLDNEAIPESCFSDAELSDLITNPEEFSNLDQENIARNGEEDSRIVLIVPKSDEEQVLQWLNGDGPYTGTALGIAAVEKSR